MKKFIRYLFDRSNAYVLFWTYVVSCMDKKNILIVDPKHICSRFSLSKRTLDRILEYGCEFEGEFVLEKTYQDKVVKIELIRGKKKASKQPLVKDMFYDQVCEIMDYFNSVVQKFGKTGFKGYNQVASRYLHKRLKEGFEVANFKDVMDSKMEWLSDPQMHKYFRPSTLFNEKFEEYLNENVKPIAQSKKDIKNEQLTDAVKRAATDNY
jgi:uncharacterized phage protein (TIGR02220 family)